MEILTHTYSFTFKCLSPLITLHSNRKSRSYISYLIQYNFLSILNGRICASTWFTRNCHFVVNKDHCFCTFTSTPPHIGAVDIFWEVINEEEGGGASAVQERSLGELLTGRGHCCSSSHLPIHAGFFHWESPLSILVWTL